MKSVKDYLTNRPISSRLDPCFSYHKATDTLCLRSACNIVLKHNFLLIFCNIVLNKIISGWSLIKKSTHVVSPIKLPPFEANAC